jgi:predicted phage tail protein
MTTDKQKKNKKQKLFDVLPKSIDHSKLLLNAVSLLHEVQKQAEDLKQGNNEEFNKLLLKLKDSYQDIGSKVSIVSDEAKKQALEGVSMLMQTWQKNKSGFPDKLTGEVDRLLDKVGLVRKTKAKAKPKSKPVAKSKPAVQVKMVPKAKVPAKAKAKVMAPKAKKKPIRKTASQKTTPADSTSTPSVTL